MKLNTLPRVRLANLPTALQELPNLTKALKGSRIYVKRDESKLGIKIFMVKTGPHDGYDPIEYDGNHLLHFLAGAVIKVVRPEKVAAAVEDTAAELRTAGHRPFILKEMGLRPLESQNILILSGN